MRRFRSLDRCGYWRWRRPRLTRDARGDAPGRTTLSTARARSAIRSRPRLAGRGCPAGSTGLDGLRRRACSAGPWMPTPAWPPSSSSGRVRTRGGSRRRPARLRSGPREAGMAGFADDAGFAAIEVMEAAGDDSGAMKAWGTGRSGSRRARSRPRRASPRRGTPLRRGGSRRRAAARIGGGDRTLDAAERALVLAGRPPATSRAARRRRSRPGPGPAASGPAPSYLRALCLQAGGARLQRRRRSRGGRALARLPASATRRSSARRNTFLAHATSGSAGRPSSPAAARIQDPGLRAECECGRRRGVPERGARFRP